MRELEHNRGLVESHEHATEFLKVLLGIAGNTAQILSACCRAAAIDSLAGLRPASTSELLRRTFEDALQCALYASGLAKRWVWLGSSVKYVSFYGS